MSIARIKQEAQQADEMIRNLAQSTEQQDEGGEPANSDDVQATDVDQGIQNTDEGVADQPTSEPGDQNTGNSSADEDARDEARKWEQRYKSLDGMLKSRDKQIAQLHELIASMQHSAQQPAQKEVSQESQQHITDEDTKMFGADMVDMARRAAREEVYAGMQSLHAEIQSLRDSLKGVETTTQHTVKESFESKLDSLAPNWRTLDRDENFIAWLRDTPARRDVFAAAVQQRDAQSVASYFQEYERITQAQQTQRTSAQQARKQQLEKQVAPGRSKTTSKDVRTSGDEKIWTRSEISETYANKKRIKPDEFSKLEREIAAAQREGRVDYNR